MIKIITNLRVYPRSPIHRFFFFPFLFILLLLRQLFSANYCIFLVFPSSHFRPSPSLILYKFNFFPSQYYFCSNHIHGDCWTPPAPAPPAAAARWKARWVKHEVNLSLSLLRISNSEKMTFNHQNKWWIRSIHIN